MSDVRKVVVVGLDGLDPKIVGRLLEEGSLPNLARLRAMGGSSTVRTTFPAQTPVAWSSFATGTNPGGHGIFDFVSRDPATYLPDLALNRYEQKSSFLPPKAVNLRRGTPMWELLGDAGIGATVIRCPCTYPPDKLRGRMLSGMGVPDLRGGLGSSTFYTAESGVLPKESENVVTLKTNGSGEIRTQLIGPRNPKTGEDVQLDFEIIADRAGRKVTIRTSGEPRELEVREGAWSEWLKVKFKVGMLQSVGGMLRFHLTRIGPHLELYASPINFTPEAPMFPISAPWDYASELQRNVGTFYTTGMVEDHTGLNNGRFGEASYLAQCEDVLREREAMMLYELERFDEGLFYCLFDTPDRVQHMFWRFGEPDHPANADPAECEEWGGVVDDHYRKCDAIVGKALEHADERTLFVALSDHGFGGFQRGVHLNTWLHDHGFLALKDGIQPGEEAGDFFRAVDWERTKAYAVGLGSMYLNLAGREAEGIVAPGDAEDVKREIAGGLAGLVDEQRGEVAITRVVSREQVYAGDYAAESPDLIVCFGKGYRVSWGTALGGVAAGHFEDNTKRWGGDHIVDPDLVPGVLFMNRPFAGDGASLVDLAPTIMGALGVEKGAKMEGESLLG